jgi:hypothetical protein
MGGGGAIFVVGAALGLSARSKYDALKAKQGQYGYNDTYQSEKSAIQSRAVTADILMTAGVATAGVGGWLWWRAGRAQIAVIPSVGDGALGAVAAASF